MGLIAAQIRLNYLQQTRLDLEYKIQLITQSRMNLAQSVTDLTQVGTDYDGDSPVAKMLAQRQAKLKILEQKLEQQMQEYQHRLQMVDTEYESCQKLIEKNIGLAFKY